MTRPPKSDGRRNFVTIFSVAGIVAVFAVAIAGPLIVGNYADITDGNAGRLGSSAQHWFGTDSLGRDIFARVVVATRLSVLMAFAAVLAGFVFGVAIGGLTSVLPPRLSRYFGIGIDLAVAFPPLLLAIILAVLFGLGVVPAVFAIGASYAPFYARVTRALASEVASLDFVAAARLLGVKRRRLIARHIFPNIAGPVVVNATMGIGSALLAFAALSFLGLGVQPPYYDWGRLLRDGLDYIYIVPAAALGPALAVVACGLVFNFAGESLVARISGRSGRQRRATPGTSYLRIGDSSECYESVSAQSDATGSIDDGTASSTEVDQHLGTGHGLIVQDLHVESVSGARPKRLVCDVSIAVRTGQIVGIVGESGAGKSISMTAVANLLPSGVRARVGGLVVDGVPLAGKNRKAMDRFLAEKLSFVFQNPMSYLNPAVRIGKQLTEQAMILGGLSRREATERALALLRDVQISNPSARLRQYPHELSGGMRQRVLIAMALMNDPRILIADEPTTALDVTIQRQILDIFRDINARRGTTIVFVSHDIGAVNSLCDRVVVMYAGRVVEELDTRALSRARHPYTRELMKSYVSVGTATQDHFHSIDGQPPNDIEASPGCPFAERCPKAQNVCFEKMPELRALDGQGGEYGVDGHNDQNTRAVTAPGGRVACFFPVDAIERTVSGA